MYAIQLRRLMLGWSSTLSAFPRTQHGERLVGALAIELLGKGVELGLLLKEIGAGRTRRFFLQRQVHAFLTTVLLRMTGLDALDRDPQPQPPHRKLGELKQSLRRSEGDSVVCADRSRQTSF